MQELIKWLENPERTYEKGCAILKKYRPEEAGFFISAKETNTESYHFRMLVNKLQNLSRKLSQNKPMDSKNPIIDVKSMVKSGLSVDLAQTPSGVVIVSNPIVDFKELPAVLQEKFLSNKTFTKNIARFHVQMKAAVNDQVRKMLMEDIAGFETERAENWTAIDNWWKEHKSENAPEQQIDQAQLNKEIANKAVARVRRIDTLKINIARASKEALTLTDKKQTGRLAKIEKWNIELSDLEKEG